LDRGASNPQSRTPAQPEEPPRLTYATKGRREPLIKAVRRLVSVSNAKGKALIYEDAHSIINLKMGVESVEALTVEQIPKALTLVDEILERVVLEGEYIAKEDDEQPQAAEEYLTHAQYHELKHLMYCISSCFHRQEQAQHHAWGTVRKTLSVEAAAKIPAYRYEEARDLIKRMDKSSMAFKCAVMELEKKFFRQGFSELPIELAELEEQKKKSLN
jgi:hypothetical protein